MTVIHLEGLRPRLSAASRRVCPATRRLGVICGNLIGHLQPALLLATGNRKNSDSGHRTQQRTDLCRLAGGQWKQRQNLGRQMTGVDLDVHLETSSESRENRMVWKLANQYSKYLYTFQKLKIFHFSFCLVSVHRSKVRLGALTRRSHELAAFLCTGEHARSVGSVPLLSMMFRYVCL